jgi:hypothetical protein
MTHLHRKISKILIFLYIHILNLKIPLQIIQYFFNIFKRKFDFWLNNLIK